MNSGRILNCRRFSSSMLCLWDNFANFVDQRLTFHARLIQDNPTAGTFRVSPLSEALLDRWQFFYHSFKLINLLSTKKSHLVFLLGYRSVDHSSF